VVSFETIEHISEHEEMFAEIKRVLKDDGLLIMSSPDKRYYSEARNYENPFHVRELHGAEFLRKLPRNIDSLEVELSGTMTPTSLKISSRFASSASNGFGCTTKKGRTTRSEDSLRPSSERL
jgi:hypothetical protein